MPRKTPEQLAKPTKQEQIAARIRLGGPEDRRDPERPNTAYRAARMLPKRRPRVKGAVGETILAAVLWLAVGDDARRRLAYREGRAHPTKAIEALKGLRAPGPLHAAIDAVVAPLRITNLYVRDAQGVPTYRVAIRRDGEGLWRVDRPRVAGVATTPKDGVALSLAHHGSEEDLFGSCPLVERVWGGGIADLAALTACADDPEFRRAVSHAWIVARAVGGCARRQALPVYLPHGGRVDFRVDETRGDGWTEPFGLVAARSRPYAQPPKGARVVVRAGEDGRNMDYPSSRYVLPTISPEFVAEGLEAEEDVDGRLYNFGSRAVITGLLPMVCAVRRMTEDGWIGLRSGDSRDAYDLERAHAALDPSVLALPRGTPYQEWAFPTYVASGRRVQPFVVRRGPFVDDAEPKVFVEYDADLVPTRALLPSHGLLQVYAETLLQRADPGTPAETRRRAVVTDLRARFGAATAREAQALLARHRVSLEPLALDSLREGYGA